jgi:hypothetical protein
MFNVLSVSIIGVIALFIYTAGLISSLNRDETANNNTRRYYLYFAPYRGRRGCPVPPLHITLHGLSPRANYTDRATAACRRSDCQLFADRGYHVVSVTDPFGRILGFLNRSRYVSIK